VHAWSSVSEKKLTLTISSTRFCGAFCG